jgi:hypothetical protein
VSTPAELKALADIESRRQAGVACGVDELRRRIDALGDVRLDRQGLHQAFREVYEALSPPGFDLLPIPDESSIAQAGHVLHLEAVLVDMTARQVVGVIKRHFELDQGFVDHQLLTLQKPYRGAGTSLVLLNQAFSFYRAASLTIVLVHAALMTGRWQWARMGFEPIPADRPHIERWAAVCLRALGGVPLPAGFPVSELALLGTGPTPETTSFKNLRERVEALVAGALANPAVSAGVQMVVDDLDRRADAETGGAWKWFDEGRWQAIAAQNGLNYDEQAAIGKVIMLAGPDWHGTFDLNDPASDAVFQQEFQRVIRTSVRPQKVVRKATIGAKIHQVLGRLRDALRRRESS